MRCIHKGGARRFTYTRINNELHEVGEKLHDGSWVLTSQTIVEKKN